MVKLEGEAGKEEGREEGVVGHLQEKVGHLQEKRERWYRREPRGTSLREGVIIVPPTPGGLLAKELKRACEEELRGSKISMSVQERGGRQLGQVLGTSVPGANERKHCQRPTCFPCNTGQVGI